MCSLRGGSGTTVRLPRPTRVRTRQVSPRRRWLRLQPFRRCHSCRWTAPRGLPEPLQEEARAEAPAEDLRDARPRRVLLPQPQALSCGRNPLREDGPKLPGARAVRLLDDLARIELRTAPSRPVVLRSAGGRRRRCWRHADGTSCPLRTYRLPTADRTRKTAQDCSGARQNIRSRPV